MMKLMDSSSVMVATVVALWSLLCSLAVPVHARRFVDDRGTVFDIQGAPTIAARAGIGAISLYHFGLPKEQVVGVYGQWAIRGSDIDLENPTGGSRFPGVDPTPAEIDFLKGAVNLSPGCYDDPSRCFEFDTTLLANLNPDYFVYIDNGELAKGAFNLTNPTSIVPIFIDTVYQSGCRNGDFTPSSSCVARSSIDIARRLEELAVALGATLPDAVKVDKQNMCEAAKAFTETMQQVQREGIRVAAAILDTTTEGFAIRTFDPVPYWTLRTFEELGMPLLHAGAEFDTYPQQDWFVNCPAGAIATSCNNPTALPVDFWLFDSRSYPIVDNADFPTAFPDPAILRGQYSYWPRNDGAISYKNIGRLLEEVTAKLRTAELLYSSTPCTNADPTSDRHNQVQSAGLGRSSYACYNEAYLQREYLSCPGLSSSAAFRTLLMSSVQTAVLVAAIVAGCGLLLL